MDKINKRRKQRGCSLCATSCLWQSGKFGFDRNLLCRVCTRVVMSVVLDVSVFIFKAKILGGWRSRHISLWLAEKKKHNLTDDGKHIQFSGSCEAGARGRELRVGWDQVFGWMVAEMGHLAHSWEVWPGEASSVGVVTLHSGQSSPGTPVLPCSTAGTGPVGQKRTVSRCSDSTLKQQVVIEMPSTVTCWTLTFYVKDTNKIEHNCDVKRKDTADRRLFVESI